MPRFSETLREYAQYPVNQGKLPTATHSGQASISGNPPYVKLHLEVVDDIVQTARFEADGCGVTTAACSVLTELLVGSSITAVKALSVENVIEALDGLPSDKHYCAHVGIKALQQALKG